MKLETFRSASMPVTELLPDLQKLSRADKLKIMQFLIFELEREEEEGERLSPELHPGVDYLINSPYDCFEAAYNMNKMLEKYKQEKSV